MHDQPHGPFPMNRWYVNRWLFSATAQDFRDAVQSMHEAMEHMTGRKFDLKVTFYRAADPAPLKFPDTPAPDKVIASVDNLRDMRAHHWRQSDFVKADLTLKPGQDNTPPRLEDMLALKQATISARWPDSRRIDFEVFPEDQGREISRFILGSNFTLWSRGYDFR